VASAREVAVKLVVRRKTPESNIKPYTTWRANRLAHSWCNKSVMTSGTASTPTALLVVLLLHHAYGIEYLHKMNQSTHMINKQVVVLTLCTVRRSTLAMLLQAGVDTLMGAAAGVAEHT
jgi:hypothetical protein